MITSLRSKTLPNLVTIISAVAPPHGGEISGSRAFHYYFFCFFSFLATRTAHTREPIFTHISSKDAVWRKERPSKQVFFEILTLGVIVPENLTNFAGSREIPAKKKRSNNSWAVEDKQNMSMEHGYKLGVTLSESVNRNFVRRPLVEKTPFPVCKKTS